METLRHGWFGPLFGEGMLAPMAGSILDHIGGTPLVALQHVGRDLPRPVWVKCEHLNPAGSVKDRIALSILDDAERRGVLRRGDTLVEATAGNTGLGLAVVAAARGYKLVCVMPEKMSQEKRRALQLLGAEIVITGNVPFDDPGYFQTVAREMAERNGWFLTDQFCNEANLLAHFEGTGPEIWRQTEGKVSAFVAGVGTGGCLTGVGRFLKSQRPEVRVVLADPLGSMLGSYVRTGRYEGDGPYQVEGIGGGRAPAIFDRSVVDLVETIPDEESFGVALRLMREEGLLVGGSSGTAVAAALRVAARHDLPEGPVVALLADSWDRYWSKGWMG